MWQRGYVPFLHAGMKLYGWCTTIRFSILLFQTDLQLSETVREPSAGLYVVVPSYLGKYANIFITCDVVASKNISAV